MKKFFLVIAVLNLLTVVWAKPKKLPKWVENPSKVYSAKEYLAASGSDKNKNLAELKAVENLSAIFSRDIKSTTVSERDVKETRSGNFQTELVSETSFNQKILSEVDQKNLIGIEIAESFFDEKSNLWYSVAILHKEKTADLYSKLIQENNTSISLLSTSAKSFAPSMKKIAYLYKAMKLAELNESYFPRFYIIHPEKCEKNKASIVSSQQLRLELDENAAKVPVSVKVTNDYNSMVLTACESLLKDFGLQISSNSADYELQIQVTSSGRTVENPHMNFCEYSVSSQIKGNSDGVIVPWNVTGRSGDKSDELAKKKAYAAISEKIKTEYREIFQEYFYQMN